MEGGMRKGKRTGKLGQCNRRAFLKEAAVIAGGAMVGSSKLLFAKAKGRLPQPNRSGIEHIVLVTMENRSFDHFLGWLPNSDGRQAGLTYTDQAGTVVSTYPLAPDYQGCAHADPD